MNSIFVDKFYEENNRKPKVNITTFGCQMNEHDSEIIMGLLSERGYESTKDRKNSDVAIINTCSIRENADKRFFGTLGQLKKLKENNPEFLVCVCGCMMQQQHIIDELKNKYRWVDVIVGTHNLHNLPKLIDNIKSEKKKQIEILPEAVEMIEDLPSKRLYAEKALVNIMYGCNNFCTYCIVPYTRGRERSRSPEAILAEIKKLVADGVREVMLLGQNVNSYKGELEDGSPCPFPKLIRLIDQIPGLERIRFMTSHPKDMSDELILAFKECHKLCKYVHLPVQAGSNEVLKRMNRKYTRESYLTLVEKLREAVPEITISTDIIVGFPGETEEDFQETLDLVRKVRYDSAFTFLYSIRKDTPAEKFTDQIPEDVKHERFNRLVELINEISGEKNKQYVGNVEEVLIESISKNNKKAVAGRTDGFKLVNLEGDESLIGKIVKVEITEGKTFSLEGKLIEA
ncbi:MAG: tRNA (N6-isopentenyl adenosine(37)-C2)-methylthiotransferase MiaB [Peptostreptococcaceae bacterium]|nr:tRNA (N6-isopentenyl adenosine(37)-C2)-methylthiotransferase MiaB [Peptostreptococcaceae bacterium]MDY5738897.1 tRNA (N6-isopentenyl adenosine(37)-C2)-methylthiotransferase MiaB [Anaerovoracaceae bacterium]